MPHRLPDSICPAQIHGRLWKQSVCCLRSAPCSGNCMHFQIHRIQIIEDDLLIIFGHGIQLQCHFYAVCIFQEQIFYWCRKSTVSVWFRLYLHFNAISRFLILPMPSLYTLFLAVSLFPTASLTVISTSFFIITTANVHFHKANSFPSPSAVPRSPSVFFSCKRFAVHRNGQFASGSVIPLIVSVPSSANPDPLVGEVSIRVGGVVSMLNLLSVFTKFNTILQEIFHILLKLSFFTLSGSILFIVLQSSGYSQSALLLRS